MSRAEAEPSARAWTLGRIALLGGILGWPLCWGWPLLDVLGAAAFMLLFAWLPGRALLVWTLRPATTLERAFLVWICGVALLGLSFLATAALQQRPLLWLLPAAALLALYLGRGREERWEPPQAIDARELLALSVALLLTLLRTHPDTPGEWFLGFGSDDELHAGSAAELRWNWPMQDPRIAGEPMRYHFLSYATCASMSRILGLPVRETMLGLTTHYNPLLIAAGTFVVARALGAGRWIACGAALALTLHADFGELVQPLGGGNWWVGTAFWVGVFKSITNSAGLALLFGLVLVLQHLLVRRADWRGTLGALLVLAGAASITKSSVLPPLLGGLGLALVWIRVRERRFEWRLAGAVAVVFAAMLPASLWFALDREGYAYSMFRPLLLNGVRTSPFTARVGELFDVADPLRCWPLILALAPLWIALFFGVPALGLAYWWRTRRQAGERGIGAFELVCVFAILASLVPSFSLASPGLSELFFLDVGVALAALLGALGLQRLIESGAPRARLAAVAALALLCAYGGAAYTFALVRPTFPAVTSGEPQRLRDALDWMRRSLPPDAVVLAEDVRFCVGQWCERRLFYSSPRFSRRQRALWVPLPPPPGTPVPPAQPSPYAPREEAQRLFMENPTPEGLARIRELLGNDAPIYALRAPARLTVHDRAYHADVPPREPDDPLAALPGVERVFANRVAAVYRLP